jgi:hypothetical protein
MIISIHHLTPRTDSNPVWPTFVCSLSGLLDKSKISQNLTRPSW